MAGYRLLLRASQVVLVVKNGPANTGNRDTDLLPEAERSPGGGHGSTPVFLPGESNGHRSLAGPQGRKELDTTEAT